MAGNLVRLNLVPGHFIPAMHVPSTLCEAHHLLAFNRQMLDKSLALVAAHTGPDEPHYAGLVGSHLRHVIEHWEALVFPAQAGCVDYDARPRDPALEASPSLAETRLRALRQQLAAWDAGMLAAPLRVHGLCGPKGELEFTVASSVGRELAFVASHAVHHFALLKDHCLHSGIALDADFGKAPATVAHERANLAAAPTISTTQSA